MGLFPGMERGPVQLLACGVWRPARLESSEQVMQHSSNRRDAKVCRAHAALQGMCDNLINALELLANLQKDGDSPVKMVVPGLLERSRRRIMDGLRKFIAVDNRAASQNWGSTERHEAQESGEPKISRQIFRELWFGKERMSSLGAHMKREKCALSSTPRLWITEDGEHRSWTRTGTPSARLFIRVSKEWNGRPCTASM